MGDLCSCEPSDAQSAKWLEATGLPFDPFISANQSSEQPLICPKCSESVKAREQLFCKHSCTRIIVSTAYLAYDQESEVGYAQQEFKYTCPRCTFQITKDSLTVAKFAVDIARDPRDTEDLKTFGSAVYLPYVCLFVVGYR